MAENKESPNGYLEKLALLADAIENTFPKSQSAIIFELEETEYREMQSYFRKIDSIHNKFKIDFSGVEIIFILKGYEEPVVEEKVKENKKFFKRFFSLFSSKKSS